MTANALKVVSSNAVEKSASAYRTIGEAASELNVPTHVLRFWETKFRQIQPVKRAGGRRHYRPEDMDILREIQDLLYKSGFTIKGAQNYLRDKNRLSTPAEHDLRHVLEEALQELKELREIVAGA